MTTLSVLNPTLADLAKLRDPDGNIAQIVEILNQNNGILDDVTFKEGNEPMGNRSTIRTGIPLPTWRKMYGYVAPNKGTTAQVVDNCGMLTARSQIDAKEAEFNGNEAAWRASEDAVHLEGMAQEFAESLFYANEATAPEEFTGFAPRYNSLSAPSGDNIIDAFSGSGGDLTSMYLVVWSPQSIFCFSPKGGQSGLKMKDMGIQTISDSNGGRMEVYEPVYSHDVGLCVRDWRQAGRIANIDVSDNATPATAKALINSMIALEERIHSLNAGRAAWYCSRTMMTYLRQGILNAVSNQLTYETVAGKRVTAFDGIPIRRVDKISHTEARVV